MEDSTLRLSGEVNHFVSLYNVLEHCVLKILNENLHDTDSCSKLDKLAWNTPITSIVVDHRRRG